MICLYLTAGFGGSLICDVILANYGIKETPVGKKNEEQRKELALI